MNECYYTLFGYPINFAVYSRQWNLSALSAHINVLLSQYPLHISAHLLCRKGLLMWLMATYTQNAATGILSVEQVQRTSFIYTDSICLWWEGAKTLSSRQWNLFAQSMKFFPRNPFLSIQAHPLSIVKMADHYLYTNCRYPILSDFKELVMLGGELRPLSPHVSTAFVQSSILQ